MARKIFQRRVLFVSCSIIACSHAVPVLAAPGGPTGAVYDSATIGVTKNGPVTTVSQSAVRGVVDWASFDVAKQEAVVFAQPDAKSATLNRVHSATASMIDGAVSANGRVIIQNGNGVIFGSNARIDVGSLVATTLSVDERAFLDSGRLVMAGSGDSSAQVRNSGRIKVADGGFVALLGGSVANDGFIQARLGSITLGAGSAATIDFTGDGLVQVAITDPVTHKATEAGALVANSGIISADGGSVVMSARTARDVMALAINLDGVIEARSIGTSGGKVSLLADGGTVQLGSASRIDASGTGGANGGQVAITGHSVNLAGGTVVDAHGNAAGGSILIGGDYRGQGTLAHANDVTVGSGALLDASGAAGGGKIVVWSDTATHFDGKALTGATAKGAAGGLVETSSSGLLDIGANASVSTYSALGRTGLWLLDPTSLAIVASGGSACSPGNANTATGASSINASTVVTALAANSVQLVADDLITVDAPIVAAGSPGGLELITTGLNSEIRVNAPILLQNGNLALRAEGNILLGTVGSTETDFTKRAIIATGSGTLWMQTRATGSIIQADNSAILAENIGAIGGAVSLGSWDNFTLNLSGSARNGRFLFRETNASNTSPVGIVVDPFTLQSLSGVQQTSTDLLETQQFTSVTHPYGPGPLDEPLTLALTGAQAGQTFDTLVFSALAYSPLPGNNNQPDPALTDSSDYGVRSLTYSIGSTTYTVAPETSAANRPTGFQLAAAGGSVITWTNPVFTTAAWGVEGFSGVGGTDPEEIGYDPQRHISENLIASLGGATSSVAATLRLFFAPDFDIQFAETAQVQYYRTTTTAGTVEIRQTALSGTPTSVSREYGDPNPAFTFQGAGPQYLDVDRYVASQIGGYDLPGPTITTSATQTSPVGDYDLVVTPPPSSGFVYNRYTYDFTDGTLTVLPAPLTIASDSFIKTYGDGDPTLTYGVTGLKNGESAATVVSGAQARSAGENVGNYPTNIGSLSANANYSIVSYTPGNLQIVPRQLTVLADSDGRIYGDSNPAWITTGQNSHFSLSGFVNNDQTTTGLSSVDFATPATILSSVSNYAITPSNGVLNGAAAGNYVLTYADGALLVDPAQLTVAANNQSRLFGEANPALTATTTGWKNGDQAANTMVAALSTPATELSNFGTYAITVDSAAISGPAAGNYVIVRLPGTLYVTAAPLLLVSADDYSRIYGTANPTFTYQVAGWRNNDEQSNSVTASLASSATIASGVGNYAITVANAAIVGPASGNYTIQTQDGVLTITPAPLTVTGGRFGKVYGDADPQFLYAVEGLRNGDLASAVLAGAISRGAGENVGNYAIGQGSLGLISANYTLRYVNGTLSITPAVLQVLALDRTKVYGTADPALGYTVSGLKFSDTAAGVLSGALVRDPGENVEVYAIGQGSLGLTSANYTLAFTSADFSITPAPLLVTGGTFSKVYGDPDPHFTYSVDGLRNGDGAAAVLNGALDRQPGENVGNYAVHQGSLGLASSNYVLTFVDGSLGITRAPLVVIADPNGKVAGGPDPLLTYHVDGLKNGDSIDVLTGGVVRVPGETPGAYPIRQGTVSLTNPNYELQFVEAPFTIINQQSTIDLLTVQSYNPWWIDYIQRGRDPDTPGDAVYRTTRYENPYIPDPLMRNYALGYVMIEKGTISTDWRAINNDRTGQHADRRPEGTPPCPAVSLTDAAACQAQSFLTDYWTSRR